MKTLEAPQKIVSDSSNFDIISPGKGIIIHLGIAPDNTVTTRVEQIKNRREQQLAATTHFTGVTRHLIHAMIELESARMIPGSEDVSPEIEVSSYQDQFAASVRELAGLNFTDQTVKGLIFGQGRLLTKGQNRMGEIPPVVKEKVVLLNNQVSDIYQKMTEFTH